MALVEVEKTAESHVQRYELILDYAQKFLMRLGLTENESKVYMYLNIHGARKAKEISKEQRIPRTETYHLLNELDRKGLIHQIADRITKFEGIGFEKAVDHLISNELKKVEELQIMRIELNELWKSSY